MPTIAPERQIYADLLVGRPDGVTWESLREYLESATVELGDISGIGTGQSGVDGVVRRASFVLRNDRAAIPGDSFSPRDRDSAWNQFGGSYAPLLWPNREVMLRVAIAGEPGQGTTSVVGVQAMPVPDYNTNTVTGETPTFLHTIPWDYGVQYRVQNESPSQSGTETIYYWDDSINRDETYVIGNDTDTLGDETDSAVLLFESLFGVAASTREAPLYVTAHTPLVPGTVTVYLDGTPSPHVEIDYVAGEIVVFDENWTTQSVVTVDYTYPGTASVYQLAYDNVVPGSETVYYDGVPTSDYSIDYAAGTITLYVNAASGTVTADYQYITYIYQRYDVPHVDLMPDTVVVYVNGVEAFDYTIDPRNGRITFDPPLTKSDVVNADYAYWVTLFHGLLGDSIRTSGPTVECEARDLAKRLQDTYIMTSRVYGSEAGTPAEDVIQQIIDDNLGPGEVTLYFPSGTASDPRPIAESPGFMVTSYIVEYMSVWDAIQQVVAQFGWFLGYRWHPNTGRMQLILMEPPRQKDANSADFVLTWTDDIYRTDLDIRDSDIRNVCKVTYRDKETGKRNAVIVEDRDSIEEYGRRAMEIEEADASLISSDEEATRLAMAAVDDLKDLSATVQLNLPFLPSVDVFSGIVVYDPRVSSTEDFYGVQSVRHTLDFDLGRFRTEVTASGRVVGAHRRWLDMETRPGGRRVLRMEDIAPIKQIVPQAIAIPQERGGTLQISEWGMLTVDPNDDERFFVSRVAMGVASSGDYVALDWDFAPKVLLSERRLVTYRPDRSTLEQRIEVYPSAITEKGFRVHCETWAAEGEIAKYTNSYSMSHDDLPKEVIYSPATIPLTTRIRVAGYNVHGLYANARYHASSRIYYQIWYKKTSDTEWTLHGEFQTTMTYFNGSFFGANTKYLTSNWEHWISVPAGTYQIKVVFKSIQSLGGGIRDSSVNVNAMDCYAEELLAVGDVSYIAIEGG